MGTEPPFESKRNYEKNVKSGRQRTPSCSISTSEGRMLYSRGRERAGLNSGPVGLADAISEDEAATGTAFALRQIE